MTSCWSMKRRSPAVSVAGCSPLADLEDFWSRERTFTAKQLAKALAEIDDLDEPDWAEAILLVEALKKVQGDTDGN